MMVATALVAAIGCAKRASPPAEPMSFETPDLAGSALIAALDRNDRRELVSLLGPVTERALASGDEVADRNLRQAFIARYRARHIWVAGGPNDLVLQVGADAWPVPIPLVREQGRWRFDGLAGARELVLRRIGANELHTIDVMRGFVAAQIEYAQSAHDGNGPGIYAAQLRSHAGMEDGLYWRPAPGKPRSPAGPLLAAASAEGYASTEGERAPYHGYLFKLLLAQGPHARGGARDYIEGGKLTGGFGLIGWPVTYGESGVMTFIVNHTGVVWQRDLGSDTTERVAAIRSFDPDDAWIPIARENEGALTDRAQSSDERARISSAP